MKRLFFPLFAGLLWLMSGTLSATERTYNVLFIQSYTKNTPWHSLLTENLENGLDKGGVKANITTGEFYQFNLSSCIRQQNSLTAQFVSFSLANLANIFYPPRFLQ